MSGSCPTAAPYSLGSISIHVSTLPGGTEGIVLQSSVSFRDTQEDPLPTDPPPKRLGPWWSWEPNHISMEGVSALYLPSGRELGQEVPTALMSPFSLQKICSKARREPEPSVELRAHVHRGSFRRRSSYAFSHQEGYAGLITRGDSLRTKGTRATGGLHP